MTFKDDVKLKDLIKYLESLKRLEETIQWYEHDNISINFHNYKGKSETICFVNPVSMKTTIYDEEGMNYELMSPVMNLLQERLLAQIEKVKQLIKEHKDVN